MRGVRCFSRYEASEGGAVSIESHHLLMGVIRGESPVVEQILSRANVTASAVRTSLEQRIAAQKKIPTSVEIPFSSDVKVALQLLEPNPSPRSSSRSISTPPCCGSITSEG
jgi:hypothetical protein